MCHKGSYAIFSIIAMSKSSGGTILRLYGLWPWMTDGCYREVVSMPLMLQTLTLMTVIMRMRGSIKWTLWSLGASAYERVSEESTSRQAASHEPRAWCRNAAKEFKASGDGELSTYEIAENLEQAARRLMEVTLAALTHCSLFHTRNALVCFTIFHAVKDQCSFLLISLQNTYVVCIRTVLRAILCFCCVWWHNSKIT